MHKLCKGSINTRYKEAINVFKIEIDCNGERRTKEKIKKNRVSEGLYIIKANATAKAKRKKKNEKKRRTFSTQASHMVTHYTTDWARTSLASQSERDGARLLLI